MQHTLYMSFCLGHIDLELTSVSVGSAVITTKTLDLSLSETIETEFGFRAKSKAFRQEVNCLNTIVLNVQSNMQCKQ